MKTIAHIITVAVLGFASAAIALAESKADLFSVNLQAFGRQHAGDVWTREDARQSVILKPGDTAGAPGWATRGWRNIPAAPGSTEITSTMGSTATFTLLNQRGGAPYQWTNTRNPVTFGNPNATLLDGKSHGTFEPGDGSKHSVFQVSDIPFAAYDVVVYLGINGAQSFSGEGSIRINDGPEQAFVMLTGEPDGTLVSITDDTTPGNHLVIRGLSGPTFKAGIRGDGFVHLGPAGIQIARAERARKPAEITDFAHDAANDEITLTWKSFPGDRYGIYWSKDGVEFMPGIEPDVPAHPTDEVTTYGPFPNPGTRAEPAFFRLGAPDLKPPTLVRVWGNNRTISLTFSEPMAAAAAINPAHFAVAGDDGRTIAVTAADFHPDASTIRLTTAAPLDPDAAHTVTMHHLTDLAGRPLGDGTTADFRTWDDNPAGVKVFILAGQSNMVGRGSVERGHGGVDGAIGSLRYQAVNDSAGYGHLLVDAGKPATSSWASRDDVRLRWDRADVGEEPRIVKGDLGPAAGGQAFGPEYGFGWAVGARFEVPVLIIKTCWGGKSLYVDFRPPAAVAARGGKVGAYYLEMIAQVGEALANLEADFPDWCGKGYQIAGFGWHQGWSDMSAVPAGEYEANMADLIRDLRAEFGQPALPISIAATGHSGAAARGDQLTVIDAQLALTDPSRHPEFAGNVFTVDTRPFWRDSTVSPTHDVSHWNGNGETYFLIGKSMGDGMVEMLKP